MIICRVFDGKVLKMRVSVDNQEELEKMFQKHIDDNIDDVITFSRMKTII